MMQAQTGRLWSIWRAPGSLMTGDGGFERSAMDGAILMQETTESIVKFILLEHEELVQPTLRDRRCREDPQQNKTAKILSSVLKHTLDLLHWHLHTLNQGPVFESFSKPSEATEPIGTVVTAHAL